MTIVEAFLEVAEASVRRGCSSLMARALISMDYRITVPKGEFGEFDEDELLTVSPDHMCIVAGMMMSGLMGPMVAVREDVSTKARGAIVGGLDRVSRGMPAEGVSDAALEANMSDNIDLI